MFFKNDKTEFSARKNGTQLQNREKKYNYKIYTYNEKVKIEFTSLEYDEKSHAILSVTDTEGQKWHCVSLHPTLNAMAPLLIERAVLGARMYRLLLGTAHQPQIHSCRGDFYARQDRSEKYIQFFKVSQDVPDFHSWASLRSRGSDQLKYKPVVGLTALKLVANFLGDNNLSETNVGLKELADVFQAVKIDPEHCFSSLFFSNDFNTMVSDLKNFKDKVPQGFFNQHEFFETLLKIINTPLESYYEIINTTFSDCFVEEKISYSRMLAYRRELIKMAAISVDGFSEYIDEKRRQLDNSRIAPEGDNSCLISEEVQSCHFSKLREEYIEHLPKQFEAQQNLMQFMVFGKPIPISHSLPIVEKQEVPVFKEGCYSFSDFEESSDSECDTDYPMSGGNFF